MRTYLIVIIALATCVFGDEGDKLAISYAESLDNEFQEMLALHGTRKLCAPSTDVPSETKKKLTFFLMARNDNYGGYPSALRLRASLQAVVWGLTRRALWDVAEVIVVDWNSQHPLVCEPLMQTVLRGVPMNCSNGAPDNGDCYQDRVRFITVPPAVVAKIYDAHNHTHHSGLSETHAFNLAARHARGEAILRLDQDTYTRDGLFDYIADVSKSAHFEDWRHFIGWYGRDCGYRRGAVPTIPHAAPDVSFDPGCVRKDRPSFSPEESPPGFGGAVGIMSFPIWLVERVMGMNENLVHWGGMESDIYDRIKELNSITPMKEWRGVLDLSKHFCGGFCHLEHDYSHEKRLVNGMDGPTLFENNADWGLFGIYSTLRQDVF